MSLWHWSISVHFVSPGFVWRVPFEVNFCGKCSSRIQVLSSLSCLQWSFLNGAMIICIEFNMLRTTPIRQSWNRIILPFQEGLLLKRVETWNHHMFIIIFVGAKRLAIVVVLWEIEPVINCRTVILWCRGIRPTDQRRNLWLCLVCKGPTNRSKD